jgi:hypothetical protein
MSAAWPAFIRRRAGRGTSLRWLNGGSQRAYTQSGKLPARHPPIVQEYRFSLRKTAIAEEGLQTAVRGLESHETPGKLGLFGGDRQFFRDQEVEGSNPFAPTT